MLDASDEEAETRALLLGHAGRVAPSAGAVLLSCRESEQRLEPAFGERISDTPLRGLLVGHPRPEACLAVRLGRTHARGPLDDALTTCTLCGRLAGDSVCEPLRIGGRTLGAVLLASVDPIGAPVREELRDACERVAPVLALQRTLEVATRHAARDPLTGLANRRAAQDALARLCAQAGRSVTPLAAALVDLDHLGSVNDRFGHEQGDGALAAVASTLAAGIRASDFVARYGGQAFLVLAPDTSQTGGAELAEKLRREVEELAVPGVGRLTVSIGVAAIPEDAATGEDLLRRAERALGIAKALGRNRVAGPTPSPAPE